MFGIISGWLKKKKELIVPAGTPVPGDCETIVGL